MNTSGQNSRFIGGITGSLATLLVLLIGVQTVAGCSGLNDTLSELGASAGESANYALNNREDTQTSVLSDVIDASITITPTRYSIRDTGVIEITLTNASDLSGDFFNVAVLLPYNSFEGLLIDYPAQPRHVSVTKPVLGVLGSAAAVTFPDLDLRPNESVPFVIPVVAFGPGDFSGTFGITAYSVPGSEIRGNFPETARFDVIVLP